MPTPEEEIVALKNQIKEFQEKGIQTESLSKSVETLQNQLKESQDREKKRELEFAIKEASIEFPEIKGMEALVSGTNVEEVKTKSKALAESIRAREKALQDKLAAANSGNRQNQWDQVPGSVPNHLAIPKDRQDQYESVRKNPALGKAAKLVQLMSMHMEDMFKKQVLHDRAKLGVGS